MDKEKGSGDMDNGWYITRFIFMLVEVKFKILVTGISFYRYDW